MIEYVLVSIYSVILNEVKDLFNKNVTEYPYLWTPAYYVILMPQIAYFCSSVAAERFGSNQKSRTFAIPFEKRVSEKTMSSYERLAARKENLKIFKKSLEV